MQEVSSIEVLSNLILDINCAELGNKKVKNIQFVRQSDSKLSYRSAEEIAEFTQQMQVIEIIISKISKDKEKK